jgi:hypothetical protein
MQSFFANVFYGNCRMSSFLVMLIWFVTIPETI